MSEIKETLDEQLGGSLSKTEAFYNKNKKVIQIGGAIVLVAVLGFIYMSYANSEKEKEAQKSLFKIEYYFELDSFNKILNGDPADPDFINAVDFVNEYSGTPSAQKAAYIAGRAYMSIGDYSTAIEYLEKFKLSDELVRAHAIGMIGDCNVELGDVDKAEGYFKDAANYSKNPLTAPLYLKKLGLVQENLGKNEQAAKNYQRIKKEFSESDQARDIEKYIARANAKAGASSFDN